MIQQPPFTLEEDKKLNVIAKRNWALANSERGAFETYSKAMAKKAAGEAVVYQITNIFDASSRIAADNILSFSPTAYSSVQIDESPEFAELRNKFNQDVLSKNRKIFWNAEYISGIKGLSWVHYGVFNNEPFVEPIPMEIVRFTLKYGKVNRAIITHLIPLAGEEFIHEVYYEKTLIDGVVKVTRTNVLRNKSNKLVDIKPLEEAGIIVAGEAQTILETKTIPLLPVFFEHIEGEIRDPFKRLIPVIEVLESTISDQLTLQKKFAQPFLDIDINTLDRMKDPETGRVNLTNLIPREAQEAPVQFITWESEQSARRESIKELYREALYVAEIESSSLGLSQNGDLPPSGLAVKRLNRLETRKSNRRKSVWEEVLAELLEGLQELYTNLNTEANFVAARPSISCTEAHQVLDPVEATNQIVLKVQNNLMSRETAIKELYDAGFDEKSELVKIINELKIFGKSESKPADNPTETAKQSKQEQEQTKASETGKTKSNE